MDVIKTIGSSGQISLGKKYAGRTVVLSELDKGVWLVKLGRFIPENERWVHTAAAQADLNEAIAWAENNAPAETDIDALEDGGE